MENKKIRNFIYLDKELLKSLYSQMFKGVAGTVVESYFTEHLSSEEKEKFLEKESLNEKVEDASAKTENKILFDYMYNQLEEKINNIIADANNIKYVDQLKKVSYIKISGSAEIEDFSRLKSYFENYNNIGEALAYFSFPNSKNISNNTLREIAKKNNLFLDPKLLQNTELLFDFYNPNGYEIIITPLTDSNIKYRCIIDTNYLRISTSKIRALYGDKPIMPWTVVGQITYIPANNMAKVNNEDIQGISPSKNLFDCLSNVEKTFSDILKNNEARIAPIAVYLENKIEDKIKQEPKA